MNLEELTEKYYPQMKEVRRYLHQNPELAFEEVLTTKKIKEILTAHGIKTEPLSCPTGVSAFIPGTCGNKTLVIREDIDALPIEEKTGLPFSSVVPGVSHACGHDIHTACLLLTGIILNELKDRLRCNVRLVFQPAEEVFKGAYSMIEELRKLTPAGDAIIGVHTSPSFRTGTIAMTRRGAQASCDLVEITVKGKGGHGAHPHETVDPIVAASYLITQMQTIVSRESDPFAPSVLTFGSIHGGSASNIVPDEVKIVGTFRAFSEEHRKNIRDSIERIGNYCAKAMRAEAEIRFENGVPPVYNDDDIFDKITAAAEKEIGKENILEKSPSPGSDDFSVYLADMPGVQFSIGTANDDESSSKALHSSDVTFDEHSMCTGARVMCRFALDF